MRIRYLFTLTLLLLGTAICVSQPATAQTSDTEDNVASEGNATRLFTSYMIGNDVMRVQLPADWADVRSGIWDVGGEPIGFLIEASEDLAQFYETKETSGIVITVSEIPLEGLAQFILLGWYDHLTDECSLIDSVQGELDVLDAEGTSSLTTVTTLFGECGESERSLTIMESASHPNYGLYLVLQLDSPLEKELLQQITNSIELNPILDGREEVEQERPVAPVVDAADEDQVSKKQEVVSLGATEDISTTTATGRSDTDIATETNIDDEESLAPEVVVAQELAEGGKIDEAIAAFEIALSIDPTIAPSAEQATIDALIKAGKNLYLEDKTWQALERYSEALALDSINTEALVGRASVYRWFEEYDKALEDLNVAIELGDDDYNYAEAFSERGYIYYQLGEYERTISDLTRAIEQSQSEAWYFELRGYAHRELWNHEEAVADFSRAIDVDDEEYNYKWAYVNRAAGYRALGALENAINDVSKAIELDPGYVWAYELRGRIYSDLEEHENSIVDTSKAIDFAEEDYDYSIAYGYRGYSFYQVDEYFDAISDLSTAIEIDSRYTWAYEIRANAHLDYGQYDEAIADFTAALELKSDDYDYSTVYSDRAIAYYELGDYAQAIDDLTKAIQINPEYTWAYEWRGYTHADAGDYTQAIADFTLAIELQEVNYDYQWAYSNRASAYYHLGQYDQALSDLDTSIQLNNGYVWAYRMRSEVLGILGRYDAAMDDLRKVTILEPRSASGWDSLCWYGTLYGFANEVVNDACESGVALADDIDTLYHRDSRGLARALTGDVEGALQDFHAFVDGHGHDDLRMTWIERLEAGEDPVEIFDKAMLETLIMESASLVNESEESEESESALNIDETDGDDSQIISVPLDFTLDPPSVLVPVPPIGSLIAYSKDGSFRQSTPGAPLFMAVPAVSEWPINDPSDFALERLELTANATIIEVTSHQSISVDGLDGFETIASGEATNSATPLLIYQVVLIKGDSYIVLKGLVGDNQKSVYLPAFQTISRSLKLH